jgi:hypothetical protein
MGFAAAFVAIASAAIAATGGSLRYLNPYAPRGTMKLRDRPRARPGCSIRGDKKRELRAWADNQVLYQQANPDTIPSKYLSSSARQARALRFAAGTAKIGPPKARKPRAKAKA